MLLLRFFLFFYCIYCCQRLFSRTKRTPKKPTKIFPNLSTHNILLFWTPKTTSNREDKGISEIAKNFAQLHSWMKKQGLYSYGRVCFSGVFLKWSKSTINRRTLTSIAHKRSSEFIFWETANWSLNIMREYHGFFPVLKKSRQVSKNRSTKLCPKKFKRYKILLNVLKGMFWKPWTLPNPKKCGFRCLSQSKTMISCICSAVYYLLWFPLSMYELS